ncbi:fiber [Squirrel monkey adenovirus]|nr:fiber [Squirrel monkey adenovirus]
MKRARVDVEGDFNPVYPFDKEDEQDQDNNNPNASSTLPPFMSSNGLTENPQGFLSLKTTSPLGYTDSGSLTVQTKQPLETTDGQLGLKLGKGFIITDDGSLQSTGVSIKAPLVAEAGGTIGVGLDSNGAIGLSSNGQLQVRVEYPLYLNSNFIKINVDPPLRIQDRKIQLSTGNGTEVNNAQIRAKINNQGLQFNNSGQITLNLANNKGLTFINNQLAVNAGGNGIVFENNGKLKFNAGNGLAYSGDAIVVKVGNGFKFTEFALNYNLGNGLQTTTGSDSKLLLKTGPEFTYNNSSLKYEAPTLWTTASPQINASVRSETDNQTTKNAKVQLTLSRCGAMVLGYISVYGAGAPLIPLNTGTTSNLRLLLAFDGEGRLINSNSMLTSSLEVKAGATVNASSGIDRRLFMPNKGAYLSSGSNSGQAHNVIFKKVYINKDLNKYCDMTLVLNENKATGQYSLYFKWDNFSSGVNNETFSTSITHFAYLGENP